MLLFCFNAVLFCGRLAQLARASRLHREGQEFESLTAYQFKVAVLTAAFFMSKEPERIGRVGVVVLWRDNGFFGGYDKGWCRGLGGGTPAFIFLQINVAFLSP